MKLNLNWILFAAVAALTASVLAGCGDKATEPAPPQGATSMPAAPGAQTQSDPSTPPKTAATVTVGKKDLKEAVCVICAVKSGATNPAPEPVVASIEYNGKGYYFCNDSEKAEFISNPDKYAVKD